MSTAPSPVTSAESSSGSSSSDDSSRTTTRNDNAHDSRTEIERFSRIILQCMSDGDYYLESAPGREVRRRVAPDFRTQVNDNSVPVMAWRESRDYYRDVCAQHGMVAIDVRDVRVEVEEQKGTALVYAEALMRLTSGMSYHFVSEMRWRRGHEGQWLWARGLTYCASRAEAGIFDDG